MLGPALRDHWLDTAIAQGSPMPLGVVSAISVHHARPLNRVAETINGLYKTELIHRRAPWKTREFVELATLEWVAWYNHHRLMEPLGYIPPAEAEANYYRQLRNTADVPVLT